MVHNALRLAFRAISDKLSKRTIVSVLNIPAFRSKNGLKANRCYVLPFIDIYSFL
jgi:hypothetical protein